MSNDIERMLKEIRAIKKDCGPNMLENMSEYIYRAKRYDVNFSIAIIYSNIALYTTASQIAKRLRHTDKIICIKHNLFCIAFDSVAENLSLKTAQNLLPMLKNINYHADYYIATIFSKDFDENYLNTINKLFERLEYSVSHDMSDIVNNEDYII